MVVQGHATAAAPTAGYAPPPGMRLVEDRPSTFAEMFHSKKFIALLVGVAFSLIAQTGLKVTPELQEQVLTLVMVYMGSQGVADAGKAYAQVKVKAESGPPVTGSP